MATTPVSIVRLPLLDEPGWVAWWIGDSVSECIEWRFGTSPQVQMSIIGVSITGAVSFTTEEEVLAYEKVMRIAGRGVNIMRRRHERSNRDNGESATAVEGDEESQPRPTYCPFTITPLCEIH